MILRKLLPCIKISFTHLIELPLYSSKFPQRGAMSEDKVELMPLVEFERELLVKIFKHASSQEVEELVSRFIEEREKYCQLLLKKLSNLEFKKSESIADRFLKSPCVFDKALGLWLLNRLSRSGSPQLLYV